MKICYCQQWLILLLLVDKLHCNCIAQKRKEKLGGKYHLAREKIWHLTIATKVCIGGLVFCAVFSSTLRSPPSPLVFAAVWRRRWGRYLRLPVTEARSFYWELGHYFTLSWPKTLKPITCRPFTGRQPFQTVFAILRISLSLAVASHLWWQVGFNVICFHLVLLVQRVFSVWRRARSRSGTWSWIGVGTEGRNRFWLIAYWVSPCGMPAWSVAIPRQTSDTNTIWYQS